MTAFKIQQQMMNKEPFELDIHKLLLTVFKIRTLGLDSPNFKQYLIICEKYNNNNK